MRKPRYKKGDSVRVVNFGKLSWEKKSKNIFPVIKKIGNLIAYDKYPDLVGKTGIIEEVIIKEKVIRYSIIGINHLFNEGQLEYVK